jgi:hypothetical protein
MPAEKVCDGISKRRFAACSAPGAGPCVRCCRRLMRRAALLLRPPRPSDPIGFHIIDRFAITGGVGEADCRGETRGNVFLQNPGQPCRILFVEAIFGAATMGGITAGRQQDRRTAGCPMYRGSLEMMLASKKSALLRRGGRGERGERGEDKRLEGVRRHRLYHD